MAKKLPVLNNDVSTSTAAPSDTWTADYFKLIEEQQKVVTIMQQKIDAVEANFTNLRGE